jgi:predicted RNA-binding protein YlxR (DUF448 family)
MTMVTTKHEDSAEPAAPRRNERTCAGCGKHAPPEELVRVVHDPSSNEIAVDLAGSAFGRGAHLHPAPACLARALKSGFARSFKAEVRADAAAVGAEIVRAADRRLEGLLSGARRAGQLAIGADAVREALREGKAETLAVIVARDAAAAARLPEVERAIATGRAIAWADKQRLGRLMMKSMARAGENSAENAREVAVIAVLQPGVAAAALRTYSMAAPFASSMGVGAEMGEEVWASSEVR